MRLQVSTTTMNALPSRPYVAVLYVLRKTQLGQLIISSNTERRSILVLRQKERILRKEKKMDKLISVSPWTYLKCEVARRYVILLMTAPCVDSILCKDCSSKQSRRRNLVDNQCPKQRNIKSDTKPRFPNPKKETWKLRADQIRLAWWVKLEKENFSNCYWR